MAEGTRMSADERRESVLRAAVPVFAAGGLHGSSTEVIAEHAGISQPYLFRLYPTKKALFIACVERGFALVRKAFVDAADGLSGDAAADAMGLAYGALLADRDLLLLQLQAYASSADEDIRKAARDGFGGLWETVAERTGFEPDELREFFSIGMLTNVAAALDLPSSNASWASDCTPIPPAASAPTS